MRTLTSGDRGRDWSIALAAGLFALIWTIVDSPEPARPEPRIIQFLLVRPTPQTRPPEPARETVRRIPVPPPPIRVPPKKVVEERRHSVAVAHTPKPKPAPPQPKTRSAAVADPLSLDAPPDWKHFALPQGANAGMGMARTAAGAAAAERALICRS